MGSCTAECKMLLFCVKTILREKKKTNFDGLATFWCGTFKTPSIAALGVFLARKTLKDDWYVCDIKAYKLKF